MSQNLHLFPKVNHAIIKNRRHFYRANCYAVKKPKSLAFIELGDFKPELTSKSILQKLQSAGFKNPVLLGGALRDDYLRNVVGVDVKTNDYDVGASINSQEILGSATSSAEATANLKAYIEKQFPGSAFIACDVALGKTGAVQHGSAAFKLASGHEIQLHLASPAEEMLTLEQILSLNGTAPISRIVMDISGRVLADAKFAEHASQLIYEPYSEILPEAAHRRGEKLASKILGLTIKPPAAHKAEVTEQHLHQTPDNASVPEGILPPEKPQLPTVDKPEAQLWSKIPKNLRGRRSPGMTRENPDNG